MTIRSRASISAHGAHGTVRVVVVDDHPIFRRGLVELINHEPGMTVCAEAATSGAAMAAMATSHADVVVVDLSLGADSGLDLVAGLTRTHPSVRTLVLSGHDERFYAERALKAGALGYIMKDQAGAELLTALRRVAMGKPYVSSAAAERILSTLGGSRHRSQEPLDRLSDRERHVLMLIGRGLGTTEIARQLHLSVKTIETHCARMKQKLGVRSGRELMRVAVTWTDRTPH